MILRSSTRGHSLLTAITLLLGTLLVACPKDDAGNGGIGGESGTGTKPYTGDAGMEAEGPCLRTSQEVWTRRVDKVDLLLMVDNSNSMAAEQQSLRREFPNFIRVLTTGNRFAGDPVPFPPVRDLHVGVVSSDMGIPGVDLPPSCHADGGDDGRLQSTPHGDMCDAQYPRFLSFIGDANIGPVTDTMKFANDIGCVATLGTGGCGFEQQLESPFKALMPKIWLDATGNVVPNPYRFNSATEEGTWGRGDVPVAQDGNQGFLRNGATEGQSLIAIVLVTDEEDCSVSKTEHLRPDDQLEPDSPYRKEDLNLRCYFHPEFLYDLQKRYLDGFRALRPGNEDLVVFAAIAGVPVDLVSEDVLLQLDYRNDAQRDAFFDTILSDPRMQQTIDPETNPGSGQGNLTPSCSRRVVGEDAPSTAFPPRRIVQLAKMFGQNGMVQSICQDDFGPAMSPIVNMIARQLGERCLRHPRFRQSDGLVPCDVIWELPAVAPPGSATPTSCDQLSFLAPVGEGHSPMNSAGGVNCRVQQLAVTELDVDSRRAPEAEGWFYDDFTEEIAKVCKPREQQRVAFSASAKPPPDVHVRLECWSDVQKLANTRTDLSQAFVQPGIGTDCSPELPAGRPRGNVACLQTLPDGTSDTSMYCHPTENVCVRSCTANVDCPPSWVCDDRPETLHVTQGRGAYCVDPTCSSQQQRQ